MHIWDCGGRELRELASVCLSTDAYGDALGWDRASRTPAVAWHPDRPLLLVAGESGLRQWTPAGVSEPEGAPAAASYRSVAFSPDGQTLWGSPSSRDEGDASGTIGPGQRWDTGVAEHPGGGLVAMLASDQGATHCLFARVDQATSPAVMRPLRRALILDCDGYETPLFSVDGRHMAVRGNAYDHSVEVFEFPSLRRVLATTLGDPSPGYPYPQEWLDQMKTWSPHNIAFGPQPGVLWIATPTGVLVEVDVETPGSGRARCADRCPIVRAGRHGDRRASCRRPRRRAGAHVSAERQHADPHHEYRCLQGCLEGCRLRVLGVHRRGAGR